MIGPGAIQGTPQRLYRAREGELLDAIVWRVYGRRDGAVEAVLEANPRLAEAGIALPAGTLVRLPDLPPPALAERIRLWD